MKTNTTIEDAIKQSHALRAVPELTVDWNMNRYIGGVAKNTPDDETSGFNKELFPIDFIIKPNRPTKGINKARIGVSTIGDDYLASGIRNGRYYISDKDDTYKYWTSQAPSSATGVMTNCKPQVIYTENVSVNKIVITTENSWATAKTFSVQTTTNAAPTDTIGAAGWTQVATQVGLGNTWKASGQIVLYWNGTAWTTIKTLGFSTTLRGVRIVVTELEGGRKITPDNSLVFSTYTTINSTGQSVENNTTGFNSFFDLIEISARLEVDLTPYVISISDTFDMGEQSHLYPLGTVTSNVASVTLSNLYQDGEGDWVPGIFSADNTDSPYHKFIETNCQMNLKYSFYDDDDEFLGTINQFEMYVNSPWSGQSDEEVTVELTDFSLFFDNSEAKLRAALWENLKVSEIVARILDSVGFTNYSIDYDVDIQTDHIIPVFWTDGEKTVWEVLGELAEASQTAIYFDGNGTLQVQTRRHAFREDAAAVWTFSSETDGTTLANISELVVDSEVEPNHYKVVHQETNWSQEKRGLPALQQVWTPEDTVTLQATPLLRRCDTTDEYFRIDPVVAKYWQYEGKVNIQGEIMGFKGKEFVYYTGATGTTKNTKIIENHDEFLTRSNETPWQYRHKNGFTGRIKIVERGVWNSEPKDHEVEALGYSMRQIYNGTRTTGVSGFIHDKKHSRVTLMSGPAANDRKDIRIATRGADTDSTFFNYGTRFRFLRQAGVSHQIAGLVINNTNSAQENGYYFEFTPTQKTEGDRSKGAFTFYSRVDGKDNQIETRQASIIEGIDYEVDVEYRVKSGSHQIRVWLNGKIICDSLVSGAKRNFGNGRFGMFIRGRSRAEYEYLYAIAREEEPELPEDFSFLDKVERGYTGNLWDREWVYEWRRRKGVPPTVPWNKAKSRKNRQFFDEFGPIVHEIREYTVDLDPAPVLHSRLFNTNDWSSVVLWYRADPFKAQFAVANTSRRNAVLNGDDTISFPGTGDSIQQTLTVFGRALVSEEGEEVIAENTDQIRRRGKIEAELTSDWIQSNQMAEDIATWMRENFSYGNENATMEVFGNPLIEVGDIVHVTYPAKSIDADFFVLGVENDFNQGLSTRITIRRRI